MKPEEKKVLVGLSTMEFVRRAEFLPFFISLQRQQGTFTLTVHGQSPAAARNTIIERALENNMTHVLFIDDDMIYEPDSLIRLMQHDVDIVTGLYLVRSFPHRPAFFDKAYNNGRCKYATMSPEFGIDNGKPGLVKGVNCGLGFVLISTEVFKKLDKPYVRLGEIEKDGWCDDVGFFNRCRAAGYDVYCDTSVQIGHISNMVIWPTRVDGEWKVRYKHPEGNIDFATYIPTIEQMKADEDKRGGDTL